MKEKLQVILSRKNIIIFMALLIGQGGMWKYYENQREQDSFRIENANAIIDLSTRLNDVYDEILTLYNINSNVERADDGSLSGEQMQLIGGNNIRVEVLKRAYNAVEEQLAEMTDREPRPLQFDFIPPSCMDARIIGVEIIEP